MEPNVRDYRLLADILPPSTIAPAYKGVINDRVIYMQAIMIADTHFRQDYFCVIKRVYTYSSTIPGIYTLFDEHERK